ISRTPEEPHRAVTVIGDDDLIARGVDLEAHWPVQASSRAGDATHRLGVAARRGLENLDRRWLEPSRLVRLRLMRQRIVWTIRPQLSPVPVVGHDQFVSAVVEIESVRIGESRCITP